MKQFPFSSALGVGGSNHARDKTLCNLPNVVLSLGVPSKHFLYISERFLYIRIY